MFSVTPVSDFSRWEDAFLSPVAGDVGSGYSEDGDLRALQKHILQSRVGTKSSCQQPTSSVSQGQGLTMGCFGTSVLPAAAGSSLMPPPTEER